MSSIFAGKFKSVQKMCCCKVLEMSTWLAFTLKNRLISSNEKKFHNEKSYPT